MLLVKTTLRQSEISHAGLGLFADEPIARGTPIWTFTAGFDLTVPQASFALMPPVQQAFMREYAYRDIDTGVWVLYVDNNRFINHSAEPNVVDIGSLNEASVAARDIRPGEELTCDYFSFDSEAGHKLKDIRQ